MANTSDRRGFLRGTLSAAAVGAASLEERILLAAVEDAPGQAARPKPDIRPESMPCGTIGKVRVSRLFLGGNLIGGWAHSRDLVYVSKLFKAYNTEAKILETIELAEQCGIKVALHTVAMPSRNMLWNYQAVDRLMKDVPSPCNGITFCIGNFWNSDGERMYDVIRRLGEKVFYVHLRSTKDYLGETPFWFNSGGPDFKKIVQALRDIGYHGDLRSEHMPSVFGENRTDIGTAWAIGYMKALLQFV